ncbi:unnamed protein product [Symbiodinium necroappetens]|uniref:Uncharacterized protein n=1 Tax=Symbiodinium necroappetens TaxID=1628268 RepID=A0A812JK78_9DINO|nr:unnamed protein product [Symbiodinium necroappetens]
MVDCRRCICGHERALDEESLIQAIAEMKLNGSPEHKLHHDISDGEALHRLVPPDRWCVTREDFSHLHQLILDALEAGWVAPSAADPFDKSDGTIGPSIYTLTDQLIKPITLAAGGMSWSLMRHPGGLACDVFVTHAWQEGIFEFTRQLLNSWPFDARNAWCCMLANPQNLNIERLISEPKSSPFALALISAKYVLVVPNEHESVYARLWCVYEAFLAFEHEKIILTATMPYHRRKLQAASTAVFSFGVGFCVGRRTSCCEYHSTPARWLTTIFCCLFFISNCVSSPLCRRIAHLVNAGLAGFFMAVSLVPLQLLHFPHKQVSAFVTAWTLFWCSMGVCLTVAEVDRVNRQATEASEMSLEAGYSGSSCFARCSWEDDALRIWREIGARSSVVDATIGVLLRAGMSTASLRRASAAGIDVKHAVDADHATLMYFVSFHVARLVTCTLVLDSPTGWAVTLFWLGAILGTVLTYVRSQKDGRAFICKVAKKVLMLDLVQIIACKIADLSFMSNTAIVLPLGTSTAFLTSILSLMGLDGAATLPGCGSILAKDQEVEKEFLCKTRLRVAAEAVSKALRCVICTEVFVKPVSSICQHVFCRDCIERALKRDARCPTCRSPLNSWEMNPNHLVQTLLDEVLVRCPRFRDSCGWSGPQDACAGHEATCLVLRSADLARRLELKEKKVAEQACTIQSLRRDILQQEQLLGHLRSQAACHHRQLAELKRELREKDCSTTLIRAQVLAELTSQLASKAQADAEKARKALASITSGHDDELVQAFVKDLQNKTIVIKVDLQKPVVEVKRTIVDKTGCPEDMFGLSHEGKILKEDSLASRYQISPEAARAEASERIQDLKNRAASRDAQLEAALTETAALEAALRSQRAKARDLSLRVERQEQRLRQLQREQHHKDLLKDAEASFSWSDASAELIAAIGELGFAEVALRGPRSSGSSDEHSSTGLLLQASLLDAAAQFLRGELESFAEALPQDTCHKEVKTASALGLLRELRRRTSSLDEIRPGSKGRKSPGGSWCLHEKSRSHAMFRGLDSRLRNVPSQPSSQGRCLRRAPEVPRAFLHHIVVACGLTSGLGLRRFVRAVLRRPGQTLRLNPRKASRDILTVIRKMGWGVHPLPWYSDGFLLSGSGQDCCFTHRRRREGVGGSLNRL